MKFEHSDDVPEGAVVDADICIIGSGAAGITLARELDGAPHKVLVLEAGGLAANPLREDEFFSIDQLGIPFRNPIPTRGRSYGGSTNLWFGRIARPDPIDLEARPWVPASGWPLRYDELEPWIRRAAVILDVPHFEKLQLGAWPSNPTIETFVQPGVSTLGVFLWAKGAFMGPHHRRALEESKNVRLLLDATAIELAPNEGSTAIESLKASGRFGNRFNVKAKTFVLACGGLENPRLLLASTRRSSAGVANGAGLVGRFFMDHPRGDGLARVDLRGLTADQVARLTLLGEKAHSQYGAVQMRLTFAPELQRREGLLNHALHAHVVSEVHELAAFYSAKRLLSRARNGSQDGAPRLADDLRTVAAGAPTLVRAGLRKLAGARPTALVVVDQMEQAPNPDSRVTLDWSRKDRWGLPRLQLDWRIDASTFQSQRRMHALFGELLEKHGIRTLRSAVLDRPHELPALHDMKHHSGTTKMSHAPSQGVVNPQLRTHDVQNLYVTGSSTFPTVGHFNPTLVIVALASRLASHLRDHAPSSR